MSLPWRALTIHAPSCGTGPGKFSIQEGSELHQEDVLLSRTLQDKLWEVRDHAEHFVKDCGDIIAGELRGIETHSITLAGCLYMTLYSRSRGSEQRQQNARQ
jgi:hypothetical protein